MYLLGKQFRGTSLYNLMLAIRVSSYRDGGPGKVIYTEPMGEDSY